LQLGHGQWFFGDPAVGIDLAAQQLHHIAPGPHRAVRQVHAEVEPQRPLQRTAEHRAQMALQTRPVDPHDELTVAAPPVHRQVLVGRRDRGQRHVRDDPLLAADDLGLSRHRDLYQEEALQLARRDPDFGAVVEIVQADLAEADGVEPRVQRPQSVQR
jgi:hypothetical protein